MDFNDAAFVSFKGSDYKIHFWYMSKGYAINVIKKLIQIKKVDSFNFLLQKTCIKTTYCQINRKTILNRAK